MKHKVIIRGRYHKNHYCFPSLNDYISEVGRSPKGANRMKQKYENIVVRSTRTHLKNLRIENPVKIHYIFGEPDRKRDYSNVASCAIKFIEDGLQKCGLIRNDGQRYVLPYTIEFRKVESHELPYIELIITEIER